MLTFAIPTWNRPRELNICVRSIAEQCTPECKIIVMDHGSDEPTEKVVNQLIKEFPFVRAVRLEREEGHDYSHAFKYLFQLADTEWTWTFGDDDMLMPGAVESMLDALKRDEFEFIHVAEEKRSAKTGKLYKATLLELCNTIGWLDMTGFITGNIIRTEKLKQCAKVESWDLYAKSAFVQSLAILEVMKDAPSAFLDYPIIKSQTEELTEETMSRWTQFDIGTRYFYLDEGLMDLRKRGVIERVSPTFFRYLSYYLWDRFMQNILSSFTTTQQYRVTPMLDDLFQRVINLTSFLPNMEARRFKAEILEVRQAMDNYEFALKITSEKAEILDGQLQAHSIEHFPFGYMKAEMKAIPRDNKFMDAPVQPVESPDTPTTD